MANITLHEVGMRDGLQIESQAVPTERTLDWIARWPEASRELSGTDIRTTLVPRYQYRIFYKVNGDEVVVRNIRSTRQLRPGERGRTG